MTEEDDEPRQLPPAKYCKYHRQHALVKDGPFVQCNFCLKDENIINGPFTWCKDCDCQCAVCKRLPKCLICEQRPKKLSDEDQKRVIEYNPDVLKRFGSTYGD